MSENKNTQNEQELWDLLSEPITTESKAPKAPKFAKPEPKAEPAPKAEPVVKSEPVAAPVVNTGAPKAEAPRTEAPKSEKKIDGFFVACMAGVAAVSVAATLLLSSMLGGNASSGSGNMQQPVFGGADVPESGWSEELEQQNNDLKLENAELRAQLEQQKEQIKDLQADLLTLMGSEDYLANAATDPNGENEVQDAQMKALETFAAIQEAYADFDREKLEELIPQMDEQLSYLTPEMLNNYYLILEYVEQPSNG